MTDQNTKRIGVRIGVALVMLVAVGAIATGGAAAADPSQTTVEVTNNVTNVNGDDPPGLPRTGNIRVTGPSPLTSSNVTITGPATATETYDGNGIVKYSVGMTPGDYTVDIDSTTIGTVTISERTYNITSKTYNISELENADTLVADVDTTASYGYRYSDNGTDDRISTATGQQDPSYIYYDFETTFDSSTGDVVAVDLSTDPYYNATVSSLSDPVTLYYSSDAVESLTLNETVNESTGGDDGSTNDPLGGSGGDSGDDQTLLYVVLGGAALLLLFGRD